MAIPDDCTPHCRAFLADLEALCDQYQVHITPEGYDRLQIWSRHSDDQEAFDWDGIEDCTDMEDLQP